MSHSIVFTYGQLFEFHPTLASPRPTVECDIRGARTKIYSTGRLERALKTKCCVYVVSTHNELKPHDDWWASRLPKDQIFLAPSRMQVMDEALEHEPTLIQLYPWVNLCEALGEPWSDRITDVEGAKRYIASIVGVQMADQIVP